MKVTRFLVSLVVLAAFATTASAQGVASLAWDSCGNLLPGTSNKNIAAGGAAELFASVTNHSAPHKAYQVFIALGSGSAGSIRDAWRFDGPAGCQGPSYIAYDHLSIAKACPAFQGALASQQIKDYSYDPISGKARVVLANSYPAGTPAMLIPTTDPTKRYHLAVFKFNHLYSTVAPTVAGDTCGELNVPVCAHFTSRAWLDKDGIEHEWATGSEFVTANDPNNDTRCPGATPAQNTSWGFIKAQYKR